MTTNTTRPPNRSALQTASGHLPDSRRRATLRVAGAAARDRRTGQRGRGQHPATLRRLVHRNRRGLGRALHRGPDRLSSGPDAGQPSDDTTAEGRALNRILIPRREVANTIATAAARARWRCSSCSPTTSPAGRRARSSSSNCSAGIRTSTTSTCTAPGRSTCEGRGIGFDRQSVRFARAYRRRAPDRFASHRRALQHSVGRAIRLAAEILFGHPLASALRGERGSPLLYLQRARPGRAFVHQPEAETDATHIAEEANVPGANPPAGVCEASRTFLRRREKPRDLGRRLGGIRSRPTGPDRSIIPADLSDWQYVPPLKHIAVDPVLGRFAFPVRINCRRRACA